jgi:hypothetical protein
MKIETKFNAGDKVWFNHCDNITSKTVFSITVIQYAYNTELSIQYKMGSENYATIVNESKVFATKQECAEAWLNKQGIVVGLKEV